MKTIINLAETVLDFPRVIRANDEMCLTWDSHNQVMSAMDFATVLVGWDLIPDPRWRDSIIESLALRTRRAPIFSAPSEWRMAHIMRALGAFQSVGDAKRNGWDKEIPEGMTDHLCRISKVRGVVTTFRPTPEVLTFGSWDSALSE